MVPSVVQNPTMIRVAVLCGRALSEQALWLLLNDNYVNHCSRATLS